MTTLVEVLQDLDAFDDGVLFAAPPWDAESKAVVMKEPDEGAQLVPPGLEYMLEVWLIKEVLAIWSEWRNGRRPTDLEALEAVRYYAQNDAYIPVELAP